MTLKYRGWVPSVLGNLSFRMLGHSGHPYQFKIISFAEKNNPECFDFCCFQKRIIEDYQLPLPIPKQLRKFYLYICSLVARVVNSENIESTLIILASGVHDEKTDTIQKIKGKVHLVLEKEYSKQVTLLKYLNNFKESNSENLEVHLDKQSLFSCDIILDRQGVCTLTAISADENKLPKNAPKSSASIDDMVNQCFYFIKDAFHSHKHHNSSEDTLISAISIQDEVSTRWSDDIVKSLYRYIIKQRPLFNKRSLGIFCYIRTFKEIIKKRSSKIENDGNLILSRTVAIEELEKSINHEIDNRENVLSFRRWFMGITFVLCQTFLFYYYQANPDEIKQIFQDNTGLLISFVVVTTAIILFYTKNMNPINWKFISIMDNLLISSFIKKRNLLWMLAAVLLSTFTFVVFYNNPIYLTALINNILTLL